MMHYVNPFLQKTLSSHSSFDFTRFIIYTSVLLYPLMYYFESIPLRHFLAVNVFTCFYIILLCIISAEDLISMTIPDIFNILLLICGILLRINSAGLEDAACAILRAASVFIIFYILSVLTKHGIGGGDIKMLSAASVITGTHAAFYAFFTAVFLAAAACLPVLFLPKEKRTGRKIPFGPFLAIGIFMQLV